MKLKPLIILLSCYLVLIAWGLTGPGRDWVLVKVKTAEGFSIDTLRYRLKGAVMRGQGLIADSISAAMPDTFVHENGIQWYKAGCSEFKIGTLLLITNPVNHFKVAAIVTHRTSPHRVTKGMRLLLEPEAAALLHFEKETVNQIRVQSIDSIGLRPHGQSDNPTSVKPADIEPIKDPVSGYTFKKTGKKLNGIASFYSLNLDGTLTATGEKFRNEKLTAASNNLPLNTWVMVTNLRNGNTVIIRINDRMHPRMAKKGRVVDLSFRAARTLDFVKAGLTKVKVEVMEVLPKAVRMKADSSSHKTPTKIDSSAVAKDSLSFIATSSRGFATVYTAAYNGRKTKSGEPYRPGLMTAASNQVPLGTRLKVSCPKSGSWVEVLVNDRLPVAADHTVIVQLSVQAAKMLGFNPQQRHSVEVLPLFSPLKNK
ncbi:MAG: septal ring lytic transglycosylase RlpA family protein [Bacteroidota bacterium]